MNLETELCNLLAKHCGEQGESEGAVETLERLLKEIIYNREHFEKLKDVKDVQCQEGNWTVSEYMRGLANGLILAVAILNEKDPVYFDALPAHNDA